ncbi:GntR family transcriptional regulator [Georgenia faecalis]|uniref:GntR family transcriptional regulator n=1 Tax=Georgenia faecalis TaxID=2483799 RepID=A0ABV9DBH4_9MICO|nr:GntR family transcriptional regulator [Georgenia faecalis]
MTLAPGADRPTGIPKYLWLKRVLLDHIDAHLTVGDPLPSERELAESMDVSRMTARRVLTDLEAEGRVTRAVGRGTFVSAPRIVLPMRLSSFTVDMRARGFTPGARTLRFTTGAPSDAAARALDLPDGGEVLTIRRLRTADGVPMAIEEVTLDAALLPGLSERDLEDTSLYTLLAQRADVVFDGGTQTVRAAPVTEEESALLEVPHHSAVLRLVRASTWRGRTVEYTVSSYRGDRYELSTAL